MAHPGRRRRPAPDGSAGGPQAALDERVLGHRRGGGERCAAALLPERRPGAAVGIAGRVSVRRAAPPGRREGVPGAGREGRLSAPGPLVPSETPRASKPARPGEDRHSLEDSASSPWSTALLPSVLLPIESPLPL